MKSLPRLLFTLTLLGIFAPFFATTPASAVTADMANKCRELAIKAHPPQRVGAKAGTAAAERKYYQDCLANGGSPPDDKTQNPPAPVR